MADRDFARLQATVKPDAARASGISGLRTALLVLGILAVVIMGFVGGYWLGSRQGQESAVVAAKARLEAQLQAQQKELQALRKQANKAAAAGEGSPTTDVGELTFYTDLPKQSVKPQPLSQPVSPAGKASSSSVPASPPPSTSPSSPSAAGKGDMMQSIIRRELARKPVGSASPAKGASYYVQVASFRDVAEAAAMQRKLQNIGLASEIRSTDIPGRGTWHRLQVGPYASRDAADAVRIDLGKKMHLKGIVIRGGG